MECKRLAQLACRRRSKEKPAPSVAPRDITPAFLDWIYRKLPTELDPEGEAELDSLTGPLHNFGWGK